MEGAERFCSQARHWLTQPTRSGAASTTNTDCRIWNEMPGKWAMTVSSAHEHEKRDQGEEAVEQVDADPAVLQERDLRGDELRRPGDRQVKPVPMAVLDLEEIPRRRIVRPGQVALHAIKRPEHVPYRLAEGVRGVLHARGLLREAAVPGIGEAHPAVVKAPHQQKCERSHRDDHDEENDR